jgi:hypothetical protein
MRTECEVVQFFYVLRTAANDPKKSNTCTRYQGKTYGRGAVQGEYLRNTGNQPKEQSPQQTTTDQKHEEQSYKFKNQYHRPNIASAIKHRHRQYYDMTPESRNSEVRIDVHCYATTR